MSLKTLPQHSSNPQSTLSIFPTHDGRQNGLGKTIWKATKKFFMLIGKVAIFLLKPFGKTLLSASQPILRPICHFIKSSFFTHKIGKPIFLLPIGNKKTF